MAINEGSSTTIGTPALASHTYSWSPGDATTAQINVSPTSTTTYTVTATTSCGSAQDSVNVTVIPAGGGGPQTAVYDAGLGAPTCGVVGSSCDSTTLVDGRANLGPEPNQPNTLDACADGTSGSYHSDESNDRIVVSTLDSADFAEGATVQVDATVYAWSTGSADALDIYYAADANSPSWTFLTTLVPPAGGAQTLSAQYTLPAGALQAVRAQFRYQGSASACTSGSYNDRDDLVFAVGTASQCGVDADCADGDYCNGVETCNESTDTCDAGTPSSCDDGVACTVDSCNSGSDSCVNLADDGLCDNGDFCDGAETCDAISDCQAASDPCPGQSCDEGSDTCVACLVDADCDNGVFCDGAESCTAGACVSGTLPTCDDGVGCTVDSCNAGTDSCRRDSICDNGDFCDGAETCDAINDCQAGTAPCTGGQTCDEVADVCVGGSSSSIWMSFRSNTAVPGVGTVTDEDIVSYDEVTGTWALEFDGSDVGLGGLEISALGILPGGDLLLSFTAAGTIGGLSIDDSDIVRFTPTSMGSTTAGSFSWYFDGSDVALTSNGEDVDSIAFHADGRLMVSTTGGFSGSGASGADEDLFVFTGTVGSSTTSGSFSLYFDGSDVGLGGNSAEDVDAATLTAGGELLFSTIGSFAVTGLSGQDEDVAQFAGSFGTSTSGSFTMRQDLSALGIAAGEDIGSMHLVQ